jgi:hypothetical protein
MDYPAWANPDGFALYGLILAIARSTRHGKSGWIFLTGHSSLRSDYPVIPNARRMRSLSIGFG